jgi:hypothetical protein
MARGRLKDRKTRIKHRRNKARVRNLVKARRAASAKTKKK